MDGLKTFEIRENDRGFNAGDIVELQEWDQELLYTGRKIVRTIGYVLDYHQKPGWVVFSLLPMKLSSIFLPLPLPLPLPVEVYPYVK